jgi:hypothetical protein
LATASLNTPDHEIIYSVMNIFTNICTSDDEHVMYLLQRNFLSFLEYILQNNPQPG